MSELFDTPDWEVALRDGLRGLPAPGASPDFDTQVLAALRAPRPWWQTLRQEARPLLAGAACSAFLMLAALSWTLRAPTPASTGAAPQRPVARALDMAVLDHLLDRPGLSAASLTAVAAPVPSDPALDGRRRSSPPRRRASRLNAPLIA